MKLRRTKGTTLGLMQAVMLIMVVIGMATFYFTQFLGGNKELINATDAGALAAAQNVLAIGLTSTEVSNLPSEFQALGVDNTGAPVGIDPTTGLPVTTTDPNTGLSVSTAIYNVFAFNRAAGLTLLVALNAAEDGSQSAINNANTLITALNSFGTKLNADLQRDPSFATTFSALTSSNTTSMLGHATISLGNNDQVQFATVPNDGTGVANIYFNSAIYANDSTLKSWILQTTNSSSTNTSQISSRYSDPSAQAGQPFVYGYKGINIGTITGVSGSPGFSTMIYTCAVNPNQLPHMIDQTRFNNSAPTSTCYAPINSTLITSQATDTHSNLLCNALGCAMLCANDNQYPISMSLGWIRVKNNPDAIAANPNQSPTLASVPLWIDSTNSLFNYELFLGAGGYGGITVANNGVFATESYDNPANAFDSGPAGYSCNTEFNAWIAYNQSTGSDPQQHNAALNPSIPQADGTYVCGFPSPTANMRYSNNFQQLATVSNMYGITSIAQYCNSDMYTDGATPQICTNDLQIFEGNYRGPNTGPNGLTAGPYDTGSQPTGGLTNLEYLKGEVLGQYWNVCKQVYEGVPPTLTFNLNAPNLPSGSKVYTRSTAIAYAVPSNQPSVAFGTIATPNDLLSQLYTYNATCANVSDTTQWTNISTPLGKLYQRCQEILPSVAISDIVALLSTYPINLNQYQYIYLPIGATRLIISQSPPGFLAPYPEFRSPGSTIPDGTQVATCSDSTWSDSAGSISLVNGTVTTTAVTVSNTVVNTILNENSSNTYGDGYTHQQPWDSFTGNLNTYDAVNFTPNSGRNYFLGELSFGNYVNGSSGSYTLPN